MSIFVTAVLILSKGTLVQKQGKRVENENRPIEATTFEEVGTRLSYLINRVHPPSIKTAANLSAASLSEQKDFLTKNGGWHPLSSFHT